MLRNWDRIKREVEGRGADDPFGDVPENLPGLLYARKILRRADPEVDERRAERDEPRRDEAERAVGELLLEAVTARAPPGRRPRARSARRHASARTPNLRCRHLGFAVRRLRL